MFNDYAKVHWMKQLEKYTIPPMKAPGYPTCWRCGEYATYGYELNETRTKYLGPICAKCASKSSKNIGT
jgi:hypothetical protein